MDTTISHTGAGTATLTSPANKTDQVTYTVANLVLDQLAAWGVNCIFGVPGDAILELVGAAATHPKVKFYSAKTETAAAFMASAYSKLTGGLGVCVAAAGPGVAQLINGLGDAFLDRTPVLVITGQVETKYIGLDYKQYVDHTALLTPFARYSAQAVVADRVPELLDQAMRTAVTEGTVGHVAIPKDIFDQPVQTQIIQPSPFLTTPRIPEESVIAGAVSLMQNAQRPVIVAGRGTCNAANYVIELAEKWQAAVVTSMVAKGKISQAHPLVLGGYGLAGSQSARDAIEQADVILLLGTTYWPEHFMPTGKTIIQVDAYPANIGAGHPVDYGIVGMLEDVLPRLSTKINRTETTDWFTQVRQMKMNWETQIAAERDTAEKTTITPAFLFGRLQQFVPDDAIIALDTGEHTLWFDRVYERNHELLISGTWRSHGFALPAANAAAFASPGRTVIAITGDGGMTMSQNELLTSVRYNLPVKVIVVNNGCLAIEKNRMEMAGLPSDEAKTTNPDFSAFADACKAKGFRAAKPSHLTSALQSALAHPGPAVVDVAVESIPIPHMPQ